ncbi:MAG: hypothetical protein KAS66_15585 [Candidatus Omnitrophica bacterium]|nr:hypothetical protein [Candidatus Omnitrophota bacterium]
MKKTLFLFTIVLLALCSAVLALEKRDQSRPRCGIENCHGLDIICGENVPKECTEIYMFGDRCRQYAKCAIVDGKCMFIESKEFNECKLCIEKCCETLENNMPESFGCESRCEQ